MWLLSFFRVLPVPSALDLEAQANPASGNRTATGASQGATAAQSGDSSRVPPAELLAAITKEASKSTEKNMVQITCALDDPEAWALIEHSSDLYPNPRLYRWC